MIHINFKAIYDLIIQNTFISYLHNSFDIQNCFFNLWVEIHLLFFWET